MEKWLVILAPYIIGTVGFCITIWATLRSQKRVELRIDGRMDQLELAWKKQAASDIAADRARALRPEVIAAAAEKVADAAYLKTMNQ